MALTPDALDVLYMRSGLGKFHLPSTAVQCEYDRCIYDFASAIEAETRKADTELIRQMLDALESVNQAMPFPVASAAITAARARLEQS